MAAMGRYTQFFLAVSLVFFVMSGCGESGSANRTATMAGPDNEATVSGEAPTEIEDSMPEATVGASPEAVPEETETAASEPEFVSAPEANGGRGYGSDGILAIRHGVHEGYERVVIDLGSGENPAEEVPEWTLSTPEGDGLLRVSLPSVVSTAVSDGSLGDGFLEGFHVVRAPDGGVFIDVLSSESFTYRTLELTDPARLVVDFRSSGDETSVPPPEEGGNTVVISPRPGETVSDPLTVSGYSRNFEARNNIALLDASGDVVARTNVASNDWAATWGYFETTLEIPPSFTGSGTLRVGSQSARDGSFEGVEIPVSGAG
jgi:hypothetical protein